MEEIRLGLFEGLDVSVYAKPKYNSDQIEQIRLGLKNGIDVNSYSNPRIKWEEMQRTRIRLGAERMK